MNNEYEIKKKIVSAIIRLNIVFSFILLTINTFHYLYYEQNVNMYYVLFALLSPFLFFCLFLILYYIGQQVSVRIAALGLVFLYSFIIDYLAFQWGTQLPMVWMGFAIIVILTGMLINSSASIFISFIHIAAFSILTHFQLTGIISYKEWSIEPTYGSIIIIVTILGIVSIVSYISNREIERSLSKARHSEELLRKEKELLEVRVEERAKEIKQLQMEKMIQLYRFAAFGRLSAGLIHDLVVPLHSLSLSLDGLSEEVAHKQIPADFKETVQIATKSAEHMKEYIQMARLQLRHEDILSLFSIPDEIEQVLSLIQSKAMQTHIYIHFLKPSSSKQLSTYGSASKFRQVITHLMLNAIDAYDSDTLKKTKKRIHIKVDKKDDCAIITVKDWGVGISEKNKRHLFEPFFTTKQVQGGTGIGLAIVGDIIEKDFEGTVSFSSVEGKGTTFTVHIPIYSHQHEKQNST